MSLQTLVISACVLFFAVGILIVALLKYLHSDWWKRWPVRLLSKLLPLMVVGSATAWALGYKYKIPGMEGIGAILTPSFFILELSILLSLPFSGLVHLISQIFKPVRNSIEKEGDYFQERRSIIKTAAVIFPVAAMTSSMTGVVDSFGAIRTPIRNIPFADLPSDLEGYKIAHLSDIHLGYYVHLDDLERAVEIIDSQKPDLALVTGDISDNIKIYSDALRIIGQLKPPHGIYASVGNHEYYRGIRAVLRAFENGPFPILINDHVNLDVGRTKIFLGGADDPRTLRKGYMQFLHNTIDITMRDAPRKSFKLLMCHRPEGLDYSSTSGINLVLAGHTHGGQLAINGKSVLEMVFPEKYPWGIYQKNTTTLHTSAGMGHWIPFRLGVPAEAPILVLKKA